MSKAPLERLRLRRTRRLAWTTMIALWALAAGLLWSDWVDGGLLLIDMITTGVVVVITVTLGASFPPHELPAFAFVAFVAVAAAVLAGVTTAVVAAGAAVVAGAVVGIWWANTLDDCRA